jgi:hypothetical protein
MKRPLIFDMLCGQKVVLDSAPSLRLGSWNGSSSLIKPVLHFKIDLLHDIDNDPEFTFRDSVCWADYHMVTYCAVYCSVSRIPGCTRIEFPRTDLVLGYYQHIWPHPVPFSAFSPRFAPCRDIAEADCPSL